MDDYITKIETGGDLESKYIKMGNHETESFEYAALSSFEKFTVFYPADITEMDEKLPVVVFVNGTGALGSKYTALQKHMASWGFITVSTDENHAWNGFSAEMSVRLMEKLNEDENIYDKVNPLKGKIDIDNIGITGHSQGGYGVINAITDQHHMNSYKAAAILSSTPLGTEDFMWEADASKINIPTIMVGSTGTFDAAIAPLEGMKEVYHLIPDNVDKVMMRRTKVDHGEMLYTADGYVTAWFMYYLQGDSAAYRAFFEEAEIVKNPLYQDILIHQAR